MKNFPLYGLAAASLALSFCFEQAPNASASARRASAPLPVAEASLLPAYEPTTPTTPPAPAEAPETAATRDSLVYGYYAQTLGVHLSHTENKALLQTVTDWMGTPYSFGSNSRRGTDCSGFVTRVYQQVYGIKLIHSSRSMFGQSKRVPRSAMQTGDLVFFRRDRGPIYHVGIYLKDGKFIHSATNGGVMVSSLRQPYYQRNFYAAGRVPGTEPKAAEQLIASVGQ